MVEDFIKYILGEFRVISGAPVSFTVALLGAALIVWIALDWRYGSVLTGRDSIIANKDSEIALLKGQRDDYKDKLSGATPDQAKARIDALEARLAGVEPRRLTASQRASMRDRLSPKAGTTFTISIVGEAAGDSPQFAADFASVFQSAGGWHISEGNVMGIGNRPPSGIALTVTNMNSPETYAVTNALRSANIEFDIRQGLARPGIALELLICTKIVQ